MWRTMRALLSSNSAVRGSGSRSLEKMRWTAARRCQPCSSSFLDSGPGFGISLFIRDSNDIANDRLELVQDRQVSGVYVTMGVGRTSPHHSQGPQVSPWDTCRLATVHELHVGSASGFDDRSNFSVDIGQGNETLRRWIVRVRDEPDIGIVSPSCGLRLGLRKIT